MVDQDISPHKKTSAIAPVGDRFLAAAFDAVIFTPIFSFILAGVFRHLERVYFMAPESFEFIVILGVSVMLICLLTLCLETFFLVWKGATPGQYFFKIRVVDASYPQGRLRFSQAFLRTFLWIIELIPLALPLMEIFSEVDRRPLHDRAAGTKVITLKKIESNHPHVLEAHFVRQTLLGVSLFIFVWMLITTAQVYHVALDGGFKKSELEENSYFCAQVTESMAKRNDQDRSKRIDQALALYFVGEISEDCLHAEADFVLWTLDEGDKAWAYLAKGMIKKYDHSQYKSYLEKACENDAAAEPCKIAEYQLDSSRPMPTNSQTAQILMVTTQYEDGKYSKAEVLFKSLMKTPGFRNFAQQGLVKTLWAENKVERAKGAYQSIMVGLPEDSRNDLSAWICHEELDQSCGSEAVEACEDLKRDIADERREINSSFIGLALIREKECRQTGAVSYVQFHQLLEQKEDVLAFVQAIARDSKKSNSERDTILQNLAFRDESVRPGFLRLMALQEWLKHPRSKKDLSLVVKFLEEKKTRDLGWIKVYQKALASVMKIGEKELAAKIIGLPSMEMARQYDFIDMQNKALAWMGKSQNRIPASVPSVDSRESSR
ncbi:MAG: hypothetical protein COT73_12545 [Bdellovibrio sp. CG10_big_fil_rev_8_21_14_0_10_47_8]|nr:MAG: hypothetical protein COT73_12545 [Bdellovibrio sp. CG10_big_fil_rev_8_21_14_0_10_47_8]